MPQVWPGGYTFAPGGNILKRPTVEIDIYWFGGYASSTLAMECNPNVGGGLLPIAAGQPVYLALTHRNREQAPSHIGFLLVSRPH